MINVHRSQVGCLYVFPSSAHLERERERRKIVALISALRKCAASEEPVVLGHVTDFGTERTCDAVPQLGGRQPLAHLKTGEELPDLVLRRGASDSNH
jgi:hypothetical protein